MCSDTTNIFLTGKAGTGKSTLLRQFVDRNRAGTVILAPTGVAAINVGGETIHRFFGLPARYIEPSDIRYRRSAGFWRSIRMIIIDEISMVRADLMRAVDLSLRTNRRSQEPFGGVRIVLVGDMGQLPPVVAEPELKQALREQLGGDYFHNWSGINECPWKVVELRHVFRQDEIEFVRVLDAIREGQVDLEILDRLNSRVRPNPPSNDSIILTPTNKRVGEINEERLRQLEGEEQTYEAVVEGDFPEKVFPTSRSLGLKVGAKVMILRNDAQGRWANGTVATVADLDEDRVWIELNGDRYELPPATWEKYAYQYDAETQSVKPTVQGRFRQIPLRLAWAMTIHKSQGLSLESVHIDLPGATWDHGQLYVALSRCRTLQGLSISRRIGPADILVHDPAFLFTRDTLLSDDATAGVGDRLPVEADGF